MISRFADGATRALAWSIVIVLILLPSLLGSLSSVAAVLQALLLVHVLFDRKAWQLLATEPLIFVFPLTFGALLIAYAITARDAGNILFIVSFLALPLSVPVFVVARRYAGRGVLLLIAALCTVGAVICAFVAVNDVFLLGYARATGFLMGGNLLARIALLLGFLGLSGIFATRSRWRVALYLGPLAGSVVVLLTGTRGAALALPAFGATFAAILLTDRRDWWQLLVVVLLGTGAIGVLLFSGRLAGIPGVIGEVVFHAFGSAKDSSTSERLAMLHGAIEAFKHSPWVGYGWANLGSAAEIGMDMTPYGSVRAGFQFHSDFSNFAVAAGVVGLLCWLALLAVPLVGVWLVPRDGLFRGLLYAGLTLTFGYAIFGITDLNFGYDLPTTLYAFLTAVVLGAFREMPPDRHT